MTISREDFELLKHELGDIAIAEHNTFQPWDEVRVKHVSILNLLERHIDKKPKLTVERVKGMIKKLRDAGLSKEECENCKDCPVCRTDAPRAYKFALDELSNEINEAENDARTEA